MNLTLVRSTSGPTGTLGRLSCARLSLCTIELAWRNNRHDISCVPAGEYQLIPYHSEKLGRVWRLHNPALGVWGLLTDAPEQMRTAILIHAANWAAQLLGCIAVGLESVPMVDPKDGKLEPAVEHSDDAMNQLRELLDGLSEEDILTIQWEGGNAPDPVPLAA